MLVLATGCLTGTGVDRRELPDDDPGIEHPARMLTCCNTWGTHWAPTASGNRLIVPVYTGQTIQGSAVVPANFAIVAIDPVSGVTDTLAKGGGRGFAALQLANNGAAYYTHFPNTTESIELRRAAPGAASAVVATPTPLIGGTFFVTPDESRLLGRTSFADANPNFTMSNPLTGDSVAALQVRHPRAISPDGSEILDEFPEVRVINVATGASRSLNWSAGLPGTPRFLKGAWIGGTLRLLILSAEIKPASSKRTLYEWDESSGATALGAFETQDIGLDHCAAWSPATRSAVLIADSIVHLTFDSYSAHFKIVAMKGGVSTTIGSVNVIEEFLDSCALSPDGKWVAYRLPSGPLFLKQVP
jgi:hypothetical protein